MRYLLCLLLPMTIGTGFFTLVHAQDDAFDYDKETKKIAASLLKALKAGEAEKMDRLYISRKELAKANKLMRKNLEGHDEDPDSLYTRKYAAFTKSFDTLWVTGQRTRVEWKKTKLKMVQYDLQASPKSVKHYDLSIYVVHDKIRYKIMVYDVLFTGKKLRLLGPVKWLGLKDY